MSRDTTIIALRQPDAIDDPLTELAREGARRILAQVLIAEADAFVAVWKDRGSAGMLRLLIGVIDCAALRGSSATAHWKNGECSQVHERPPGRTSVTPLACCWWGELRLSRSPQVRHSGSRVVLVWLGGPAHVTTWIVECIATFLDCREFKTSEGGSTGQHSKPTVIR
jgi:hypothetical protein